MRDIIIISAGNWVGILGIIFMIVAGVTFIGFIVKLITDLKKEKRKRKI